jgi:hypothetical protein
MAMRNGLFYPSLRDANARPFANGTGPSQNNSPDDFNIRGPGQVATNEVAFTAAGATTNIFAVTGGVQIMRIAGVFTDVTDVADIDALSLDFWDGAAPQQITSLAGTTCDGVALNSQLIKTGNNTVAITLLDAAAGVINEGLGPGVGWPFTYNCKNGVTCYIRFTYTSAGGCDAAILWAVDWRHTIRITHGTIVAV